MFKITIVEVTQKEVKAAAEWVKIADTSGDDGKAKYGYGPANPNVIVREIETKRLEQTVDALDLAAVIKAVNGL